MLGQTQAAIVEFAQISDPAGFLASTNYLNTPTNIITLTAPSPASGLRFTHWTINGVRVNTSVGNAQNPAAFTLLEPTLAVAHYLPETQDTDGDGIPDWFEVFYFDSLAQAAASDLDADGYSLAQEFTYGLNPLVWEPLPTVEVVPGGLARARSGLLTMNLDLSPTYQLLSSPPGFIAVTNTVTNGMAITTPDLWNQNVSGYRFAYWDLDGVRQQDAAGVALGSFTFMVTSNTVATAHYLPEAQDTDADGVADWFEVVYFGNLTQGANSDPDGDGYTVAQELAYGLNPAVWEPLPTVEYVPGGIAQARSALVAVNLEGFPRYWLLSDPPGFLAISNIVNAGAIVTTPDLWNQNFSGYRFAYWDLDGVRQQDAAGVAVGKLSFAVTHDRTATAHYLPEAQDTDADGVADWFEVTYFGNLTQGAGSDPDGDGYTVAQELAYGLNPAVWEPLPTVEYVPGGIARARNTGIVIMDLQPFERLQYTLVDGVLSNLFTGFGGTPGADGMDFGDATAPALGDWDGDGDLDLFVAFAPGQVRAFENIGSRFTMNLSERTGNFAALATVCAGFNTPALAMGDWNADGSADLVVGGSGTTAIILSSPGHFNLPQTFAVNCALATGSTKAIPAFGEMNGDGLVDLFLMVADGTVNVYTNTGSPSAPFAAPPAISNLLSQAVPNGTGLAVADINYDGRPDVLAADADGRIWEFHANGGGGFTLISKVWGGAGAGFASQLTLASGDLDGDGDTDVVGGFSEGGLLALRDPRYAVPTNLRAVGGAASIFLEWDADRQSRIAGYNVYRSVPDTNTFSMLNSNRVVVPRYEDEQPVAGWTNFYRVTAVSGVIYPGNSVPQYIESRASEIVGAVVGGVTLWMPDYYGQPGSNTVLQINTPLASGISGTNLEIRMSYNPALLTPLAQVSAALPSVEKTALTESLVITNNGATATGELIITGLGGGPITGQGNLFDVNFRVAPGAVVGTQDTNAFTGVTLLDALGNLVAVNATDTAIFTVASGYFPGDATGDGILDQSDFTLLMQLATGKREPTVQELAAMDMNGNGVVDKDDAHLILRMIKGKAPNPK